jgi:membrane protein
MASRYLLPWLITVFTFSFVYKVVPACPVPWRAAGLAGLVAGSLWESIKIAFAWYVGHVANYARIYGTLETVVVFTIWVNLSSVLLLWGGELAALVSSHRKLDGAPGDDVGQRGG